ncbi:MAG: right-handed parallel beta-helix repeat-containing protein [Bacteroidota bacterium]
MPQPFLPTFSRWIFVLSFLFLFPFVGSSQTPPTVVNIGSLGIKPGEDATPYLYQVFKKAESSQQIKIVFPKGRYDFYPDKAFEKYCSISNNNSGLRRTAFPILGFRQVEIDGGGSSFIFHGKMIPFLIENSQNISLHHFSIDWAESLHFEGTVVATDSVKKTIDLKVLKDCQYEVRNESLVYKGYQWEQTFRWNMFFDSRTKRPLYNTNNYYLPEGNKRVKALSEGVIRLFDVKKEVPPLGAVLIDWSGRDVPGFRVLNAKNLSIQEVTLHHCLAMGIIAERTENISLLKFNVLLPPKSDRLVTLIADATHFVNCKGNISLDSCVFENMLDDASNIHGVYENVVDYLDDSTIGIRLNHVEQNGYTFAEPGDSVRFINRNTMLPALIAKVLKVEPVNEKYSLITLDRPVKGQLPEASAVENISWCIHSATIRHCISRQNRARSILIQTTGKVLIEENYFSPMMDGIIIGGEGNYWFESGPVNHVVIRKNVFEDFGLDGTAYALNICPDVKKEYRKAGFYHQNVVFEQNTIKTFDVPFIYARSTDGLTIRNNTLVQTHTFKGLSHEPVEIVVEYCKNIVVEQNKHQGNTKKLSVRIENSDMKTARISPKSLVAETK